MSVFSRPPHAVTIYPTVPVDDGYGGTMPGEGDPIEARVYVAPMSSATFDNDAEEGYATTLDYQVTARSLPAGPWSRVTWDGVDFTVIGEPRRYSRNRRTSHDVATIRRR